MRYIEVPYGNLFWIVPLLFFIFSCFIIYKFYTEEYNFFVSDKDFCLVLLLVFCFFSLFIIFEFQYMNEIDKDIIQRAEMTKQEKYTVVSLDIETQKGYEVLFNTDKINLLNEYNGNYSPAFISNKDEKNLEKEDYFKDRLVVEDRKKVKLFFEKDIEGESFKLDLNDFEIILTRGKNEKLNDTKRFPSKKGGESFIPRPSFKVISNEEIFIPKEVHLEDLKKKGKISFQRPLFKVISNEEIKELTFGNKNLISKVYSQIEHFPSSVVYYIKQKGETSIVVRTADNKYYYLTLRITENGNEILKL